MRTKHLLTILTILLLVSPAISEQREWTEQATGRTTRAEYISSDGKTVIIRFNRQNIPLELSRLSEADRDYVAKKIAESKPKTNSDLYTDFIDGEFVHSKKPVAEGGLPFWLYGDKKMLRDDENYPLVIVLHGRRNNAKPNEEFRVQSIATPFAKKENQKKHPCFVVQPYYPPQSGWEKLPEKLDATIESLMEHLPVDTNRIYLMGFSNGGQGTLRVLAKHPDRFAGAITVAGPVGKNEVVGKIKTPIRSWVGENDTTDNKRDRKVAVIKALKEDGVDAECVVVKGAGHSCHDVPLKDKKVFEWLFSQSLK